MIRTILKYLLVGMVIALVLLWLWSGGWTLIKIEVANLGNPIDILRGTSTSTYQIRLPFSPSVPQGPDISGLVARGDSMSDGGSSDGTQISGTASGSGAPSIYQGEVTLAAAHAGSSDPAHEYVVIESTAGGPIDISGWTLQSMLTGKREVLPEAAQPLVAGAINRVAPVVLSPRQVAIVTTGTSPVGASFQENICTGYLAQEQNFDPSLQNACPSPLDSVPESLPADQTYGANCFDYMRTIPQCEYVTQVPASLSANCRALIASEFSYNGCVSDNQHRTDFALGEWRLYLGSGIELWDNAHDIIRLTDSSGRVVDAVSY